jgi:hypothetical protein
MVGVGPMHGRADALEINPLTQAGRPMCQRARVAGGDRCLARADAKLAVRKPWAEQAWRAAQRRATGWGHEVQGHKAGASQGVGHDGGPASLGGCRLQCSQSSRWKWLCGAVRAAVERAVLGAVDLELPSRIKSELERTQPVQVLEAGLQTRRFPLFRRLSFAPCPYFLHPPSSIQLQQTASNIQPNIA